MALHQGRVLVRGRVRLEAGAAPDEPRPAAAEAPDAVLVQRLLELGDAAERRSDRLGELAAAGAAAVGALIASFTGRSYPRSVLRQVAIAVFASGVTYLVGAAVGVGVT